MAKVRIAQNSHYSSTKILSHPQKNFVEYILIDINYLPDDSYNDPPTIWKAPKTWDFDSASRLQRPWRRFSFGPRTVRRWHRDPTSLPQGEWHEDTEKAMAQAQTDFLAHCFFLKKQRAGYGYCSKCFFFKIILLTGIWNLGFFSVLESYLFFLKPVAILLFRYLALEGDFYWRSRLSAHVATIWNFKV